MKKYIDVYVKYYLLNYNKVFKGIEEHYRRMKFPELEAEYRHKELVDTIYKYYEGFKAFIRDLSDEQFSKHWQFLIFIRDSYMKLLLSIKDLNSVLKKSSNRARFNCYFYMKISTEVKLEIIEYKKRLKLDNIKRTISARNRGVTFYMDRMWKERKSNSNKDTKILKRAKKKRD